jgi:AhpD family alkylhydroperoxidase
MTPRANIYANSFDRVKPLIDLSNTIEAQGLEKSLMELVKIRASQINGCAVCLHMHHRDAIKAGETELRVVMLDAWRESPLYSDRERAALAWTEALTRVAEKGAPDELYEMLKANFTEEEQVSLTLLIGVINSFNRLNVGFAIPHPASEQRQAA